MLYRINRFSIEKTSRVAAAVYFGLGVLVVPFVLLGSFLGISTGDSGPSHDPMRPLMAIALPAFYGIIGYITTAVALWIYNLVARNGGGIELDIVYAVEPPPEPGSNAAGPGSASLR